MQFSSIQIVPNINNEASGPSYSVTRLCEALRLAGDDTRLAVLEPKPTGADYDFAKYFPYDRGPKRLGISGEMKSWLRAKATSGKSKILHNHSLWMMTNTYATKAVRGTSCKLVVSPRGTLSKTAMARTGMLKALLKPLMFTPVVKSADAFHATSMQEYLDIRAMGFTQPVAVLPNGVDVPELQNNTSSGNRQLLYLGRIHPIKGIDFLLRAWQAIQADFPSWQLVLAGPGEAEYVEELKKLAVSLKLERYEFTGPLYGEEKLQAYRNAELYVLPTHSENFGMTVAEALAAGTPAIVSKGAPWEAIENAGAGWWVDIGTEPLIAALSKALAKSPEELIILGGKGRDWMIRDFSWNVIGKNMLEFYRWLCEGGKVPDFVMVD